MSVRHAFVQARYALSETCRFPAGGGRNKKFE